MFYDAHYLFPRAWTQEQAAPGVPENTPLAFFGNNQISQSFISGNDNLSMIELWLAGEPDRKVFLSLTDDQDLALSGELSLRKGRDGGYYRLEFPNIDDAKGRRFLVTLTAPDATIDVPVVTRTVGGDRLSGTLRLNENNRPGNLELRTYASGWPGDWWLQTLGEQLLPAIFRLRLQQYKPDLFKEPLFTVTFVLSLFLSVIYLILARPQNPTGATRINRAVGWATVTILALFLIWQIFSGHIKLPFAGDREVLLAADRPLEGVPLAGGDRRLIRDVISDLWTLEREPEARFVDSDLLGGFPALRVPANSAVNYPLTVPPSTYLRTGVAGDGSGFMSFEVVVNGESVNKQEVAAVENPGVDDILWNDVELSSWAGQDVVIRLETVSESAAVQGLWIMPQLESKSPWLLPDPLPDFLDLQPANVQFGDSVELLEYTVRQAEGDQMIEVDLFWRPIKNVDSYATVFVHLLDDQGNLIAQHDGQPVYGAYPLPVWQPGAIIQDTHLLTMPVDLQPVDYRLAVGLYNPQTLQRWPAVGADGSAVPGDAALLDIDSELLR
ncbi:MAG: hypothetical protein R3293_19215 [Candidatus Promineifilaceae bacterium]|nr:hypothetical protein [Candidatus Promineifilaceae bacterium]